MDFKKLLKIAQDNLKPKQVSRTTYVGAVSAAIEMESGNVYTGLSIDTPCSMGFCAEHAAIASALNHEESKIVKVVAIDENHKILPPCGRCRELIHQINDHNLDCEVLIGEKVYTLKELLPNPWN